MKKIVLIAISIILLISHAVIAREITIATGEWPPYVSDAAVRSGVCADIVKASFAAEGIDVQFEFYPWKRALLKLKRGGVGASFPWVKRANREQYSLYSDPIYELRSTLFYMKDRFPEKVVLSKELFSKCKVGVPLGYELGNDLLKLGFKCVSIPASKNGFEMLVKNRFDFLLESDDVGRYMIREFYPRQVADFAEISAPIKVEELFLIFPKDNIRSGFFLEMFNKGLQKIKADGSYARVVDSY